MININEQLKEEMVRISDPLLASENKSYFKSPFDFLGITKKKLNSIGHNFYRSHTKYCEDDIIEELDLLWQCDVHEYKTMAIILAGYYINKLESRHSFKVFERWVFQCESWDHLDELCIKVIGILLLNNTELSATIFSWASSPKLWTRRASLISHLPSIRRKRANYDLIRQTCKLLAGDEDFFIRKAIGWILREIGDVDRENAIELIKLLSPILSRLSMREATRKISTKT